ncbi:MAG: DUF4897 domain-containing protein [Firmicutes bacterium]|nr:DUF4897 domain-containing protein [Bacillota bacterium]
MRRWLLILVLLLVPGILSAWQLRTRVDQGVYGNDIVYTIDREGNARVTMVDKVYFTSPAVEKNFEGTMTREVSTRDIETRTREMIKRLGQEAGFTGWSAEDFSGYRKKEAGFGARVITFTWKNFARRQGDQWVVDFRFAQKIMMNERSSLTIIPPPGTKPLQVEPQADGISQNRLVWQGPREMPWPHLVLSR